MVIKRNQYICKCMLVLISMVIFVGSALAFESGDLLTITKIEDPSIRKELFIQLLNGLDENKRFMILIYLSMACVESNDLASAKKYAFELLDKAIDYKNSWNYGDAIHDANIVLGVVALDDGLLELSKKHLIDAGNTTTTPRLSNFGPEMVLADKLLKIGEQEIVVTYLQLLRKVWINDHGKLKKWLAIVKDGGHPDFGFHVMDQAN